MKNYWQIFLLAVIIVLALFLLSGKWQCNKAPDHSVDLRFVQEQKRLRDSAYKADLVKEEKFKADTARLKKAVDSVSTQLAVTKKLLNKTQAKAGDLAVGLLASKANNDTAGFKKNAEALAEEVIALNGVVDHYEGLNETLFSQVDSLQQITETRLEETKTLSAQMKHDVDSVTALYETLHIDYEKVKKKLDKQFTVGLGAAGGVSFRGPATGTVGITLSRTIFRF